MVSYMEYRLSDGELRGVRSRPIHPVHHSNQGTVSIPLPDCITSTLTDELIQDKYIYHLMYIASLRSLNRMWDECHLSRAECHLSQVRTPSPLWRVEVVNGGGGGRKKCVDFLDPNKLGIHPNTIQS